MKKVRIVVDTLVIIIVPENHTWLSCLVCVEARNSEFFVPCILDMIKKSPWIPIK